MLDQAAFTVWVTALHAAVALPIYAAVRGIQRVRRRTAVR